MRKLLVAVALAVLGSAAAAHGVLEGGFERGRVALAQGQHIGAAGHEPALGIGLRALRAQPRQRGALRQLEQVRRLLHGLDRGEQGFSAIARRTTLRSFALRQC